MSTLTINWTLPTVRSDGTAMAVTEIASVSVFDMASIAPAVPVMTIPGAPTSTTVDPVVGDHGFTVVVTDTAGRVGLPSNVAVVTVPAPPPVIAPPGAPTNVTATFAP